MRRKRALTARHPLSAPAPAQACASAPEFRLDAAFPTHARMQQFIERASRDGHVAVCTGYAGSAELPWLTRVGLRTREGLAGLGILQAQFSDLATLLGGRLIGI